MFVDADPDDSDDGAVAGLRAAERSSSAAPTPRRSAAPFTANPCSAPLQPVEHRLLPGGSSGGSAAALAAGSSRRDHLRRRRQRPDPRRAVRAGRPQADHRLSGTQRAARWIELSTQGVTATTVADVVLQAQVVARRRRATGCRHRPLPASSPRPDRRASGPVGPSGPMSTPSSKPPTRHPSTPSRPTASPSSGWTPLRRPGDHRLVLHLVRELAHSLAGNVTAGRASTPRCRTSCGSASACRWRTGRHPATPRARRPDRRHARGRLGPWRCRPWNVQDWTRPEARGPTPARSPEIRRSQPTPRHQPDRAPRRERADGTRRPGRADGSAAGGAPLVRRVWRSAWPRCWALRVPGR